MRLGTTARPRVPSTSSAVTAATVSAIHSVTLVTVYQCTGPSPNSGLTMN